MKYGELSLGQIEAIVNKLGGMDGVQRFLSGQATVKSVEYLIDCNASPFVPNGWRVEQHDKGGMIQFDASNVELYLSKQQKKGNSISGAELRKELKDKKVLNANVLDYLLAHPELIPEEWKGKAIFFWGTIYRGSFGSLDVRYLYWGGGAWSWGSRWVGYGFDAGYPAAVSAD